VTSAPVCVAAIMLSPVLSCGQYFSDNKGCAYSTVLDYPVAVCVREVASLARRRSCRFYSFNIYLFVLFIYLLIYYLTYSVMLSVAENV
jgi:hypothetical protein